MTHTLDIVREIERQNFTVELKVTRAREARVRLWIARKLIALAGWIARIGVRFEETPWKRPADRIRTGEASVEAAFPLRPPPSRTGIVSCP